MPLLRNLFIVLDPLLVHTLIGCNNISFKQIHTLSISFDRRIPKIKNYVEFKTACVSLLKECRNVQMIYCYGDCTKALLKVLEEDSMENGGLISHPISISTRNGKPEIKLDAGSVQRLEQIHVLSDELGGLEVDFAGKSKEDETQ
jgi:hypothetical protein